jgi:hypothetical protein
MKAGGPRSFITASSAGTSTRARRTVRRENVRSAALLTGACGFEGMASTGNGGANKIPYCRKGEQPLASSTRS